MRVVLDHQIFSEQQYGGVTKYLCEIASRIRNLDGFHLEILCPLFRTQYLADENSSMVWGTHIGACPIPNRALRVINSALARRKMAIEPPDVVHETYYSDRRVAPPQSRVVVTVHDMIHEKFPQYFSPGDTTSRLKKAAVLRADHVICVSENTRSDLMELFGIDPQKITMIHHGASTLSTQPHSLPPIDRPYVVYVGVRSGYKNFTRLLQAFGASAFLKGNVTLLCFGGGELTAAEHEEIVRAGLSPEQVIHLRGSDETLGTVYAHAQALIYPSLYEGFGLPLLEAMAMGCPVICSDTSSLPEVGGDAVEYFDPSSPESIREAMERALSSPDRRRDMTARGIARSERFSWGRCASETADVYVRTLRQPGDMRSATV